MEKDNLMRLNPFAIIFLLVFLSCGTEQSQIDDFEGEFANEESTLAKDASGFKVYTLPAPLQIATAVKLFELPYSDDLIAITKASEATFPNSHMKALNMGIFAVDMGYTTIYEQHQTAIDYSTKVHKLADELDISGGFAESLIKRFENNRDNQDSLYRIVLTGFNKVHKYLQDNHRMDVGLLISAGSLIEGLYLSLEFTKIKKDARLLLLIAQQQIFVDNIIELMEVYAEKPEIEKLLQDMKAIRAAFHGIELPIGKKNVAITEEQLEVLIELVTEIRRNIIT